MPVDGGEYSVANIRLLSNVTLRINRGAALVNITYDQDKTQNTDFNPDDDLYQNALIYAVRKSYCLRSTLRPRRPPPSATFFLLPPDTGKALRTIFSP